MHADSSAPSQDSCPWLQGHKLTGLVSVYYHCIWNHPKLTGFPQSQCDIYHEPIGCLGSFWLVLPDSPRWAAFNWLVVPILSWAERDSWASLSRHLSSLRRLQQASSRGDWVPRGWERKLWGIVAWAREGTWCHFLHILLAKIIQRVKASLDSRALALMGGIPKILWPFLIDYGPTGIRYKSEAGQLWDNRDQRASSAPKFHTGLV